MNTKLHLMDDRSIVKTVDVKKTKNGLLDAWLELMVRLENLVDEVPCYVYDMDKADWARVKRDAGRARNMDVSKSSITEWNTGVFTVVWHEIP